MFVLSLRRFLRCAVCALVLALLAECTLYALAYDTLPEQVLRLHVVANSDSDEDQAIKLQVRDALLTIAAALCEEAKTPYEAQSALCAHMETLERTALAALEDAGSSHGVRLFFTDMKFPPCAYAGFSLPAGEYRALRVVIGEGEGHNWWCVLFPGLCLPCGGAVQFEDALNPAQQEVAFPGEIKLRLKLVDWLREIFH